MLSPSKVKDLDWVEGGTRPFSLPAGRLMAGFVLIEASVVIATAAATFNADAEKFLLQSMEVNVDGDVVQKIGGRSAWHRGQLLDGPAGYSITALPSGSQSPGTYPVRVRFPFFFAPPDNDLGEQAWLASHVKANPFLNLTFGQASDLKASGSGAVTITSVSVSLYVTYLNKKEKQPKYFTYLFGTPKPIAVASDQFVYDLAPGSGLMARNFYFEARYAGVLSDTPVEEIALYGKDDQKLFGKITWTELQDSNRKRYGRAPSAGTAIVDFDVLKNWVGNLDESNLSDFKFVMKVAAPSGTTDVTIYREEYRKVPPAA